MPMVETCAVCGLDLFWVQMDVKTSKFRKGDETGDYYHIFDSKKAGKYKFIHLPVPQLEDPSIQGDSDLIREAIESSNDFNSRGKVEPRASVMPENLPSIKSWVL